MVGIGMGALWGCGLLMVVTTWSRHRRPALLSRVQPYVRDVRPELGPMAGLPWRNRAVGLLDRALGGRASVERRLARLGRSSGTVEDFRLRQLVWAAVGFAATAACGLFGLALGGRSVTLWVVACVLAAVLAALACDQHLTARVALRDRRLAEELPVAADLLALTVAAGESPVAGLERTARAMRGALADDIADVLADIKTGSSMVAAFDAMAARTGVPSVARFAEGLSVALERGTPLVDVLHAQAADVRESARRALIEEGGRREIAMMLPVVFLVLPVTVVFAFFPGYVGLHLN